MSNSEFVKEVLKNWWMFVSLGIFVWVGYKIAVAMAPIDERFYPPRKHVSLQFAGCLGFIMLVVFVFILNALGIVK